MFKRKSLLLGIGVVLVLGLLGVNTVFAADEEAIRLKVCGDCR